MALLAGVAACGTPGGPEEEATRPIRLGLLVPQTGVGSYVGQSMIDYVTMAADEINGSGGVRGRRLEIVVKDTATDARTTTTAARDLVRVADVIFGPFTGIELSPALKIATEAQKLLFFPTEGSSLLPQCTDVLVGLGQLDSQQNGPWIPHLIKTYGSKVYFVGTDFEYPRFVLDNLKETLAANGGELVGADFYPFATGDFSTSLRKAQSTGADVVFTVVTGNDFFTFANQYKQFGVKAQFASPGMDELRAHELAGVLPGAETNQAWVASLTTAESSQFVQRANDRFGGKAAFAQIGESLYTGVHAYKAAVEAAGTTETGAVRTALRGVTVANAPQGTATFVKFGGWTQLVTNSIIAKVTPGGSLEIVEVLGPQQPRDTGEVPTGCGG
ncbi:urea transport system substrate-binding protein [Allocatelliglobosispora scoriae]|uniref:Urea transport system substrate-binding protein n=1 Tax=Allocatelliglobosispora scoriae TaxID=643052 RepID=A0A841C5T7_9ACTN|nr:ABC transporter substrate-binding protein [Allocatelliglobosispora scoriae]MBB5874493.1 urea transport system substrate-binding protein [Allocatelliglobosispora scoriae]